jgi:hypothetical protein
MTTPAAWQYDSVKDPKEISAMQKIAHHIGK